MTQMEEVFDSLNLNESKRKDIRPLLTGLTPSMLTSMDYASTIKMLLTLKVPRSYAVALTIASMAYERQS